MRLLISGAHEGLKQAIAKVIGSTLQRCRVHRARNALAQVARRQHAMIAAVVRAAFVQEDEAHARSQWLETANKLRERFPKLAVLMGNADDEVLAFMEFPKWHWPQLVSTNLPERLNK